MELLAKLTKDEHAKAGDLAKFYVEGTGTPERPVGVFFVNVTPVDGYSLENGDGMRRTISERTEKHKSVAKILEAFVDGEGNPITPEQARDAVAKFKTFDSASEKEKVEARIKSATEQYDRKYQAEIAKYKTEVSSRDKEIETYVLDHEVARVLTTPGTKGYFDLLIHPIRESARIERGANGKHEVYFVDEAGNPILTSVSGSSAKMGVEERIKSMMKIPKYAPGFEGSGASGSGSSSTETRRSVTNGKPEEPSGSKSPTEMLKMARRALAAKAQ
jgi:hypothetical protein